MSDNNSTDDTQLIVESFKSNLDIKYCKNNENIGIARNFLNVVDMADGDFIWLVGDDDLVMPNAIERLTEIIEEMHDVDFIFVNAYNLSVEYINKYPSPFDMNNLPLKMDLYSNWTNEGVTPFIRLINPKVSFDFLGGMFLSVFRKELWDQNIKALNYAAISDLRTFSHFDNTFPHLKIFSNAFGKSKAYFNKKPLVVSVYGVREWSPMSPLVMSVRLVEALSEYRKNGLPIWNYLYCRNYALRHFMPDMFRMYLNKEKSGYEYVNLFGLILKNFLFPNMYLSILYYINEKLIKLLKVSLSMFVKNGV